MCMYINMWYSFWKIKIGGHRLHINIKSILIIKHYLSSYHKTLYGELYPQLMNSIV
jgi:hypothetical protein